MPSIRPFEQKFEKVAPPFESDPRYEKSPVVFPRDIQKYPDFVRVHNHKLNCTMKGKECLTCDVVGGVHVLSNVKLVLLGDQHLPAAAGAEGQCIPVIRVENGSFEAIKQTLWAQKTLGFKVAEGAVFAVSLTQYACMVSSDMFWHGFDDLARWIKERMHGELVPFIMPYSSGLSDQQLSRIQTILNDMRARFLGENQGKWDWRFSLWRPLYDFFESNLVTKRKVLVPPSKLKRLNGTYAVIESPQRAYQGVHSDFAKSYPPDLEKSFLPEILKEIEKGVPQKMRPVAPPPEFITKGFKREGAMIDQGPSDIPTMYLYGNSILRETGAFMVEHDLATDYEIVIHCKGMDICDLLDEYPIPPVRNEKDILVMHFLGNLSIPRCKYGKWNETFHYENPVVHDDAGVSNLVDKVILAVAKAKKTFKGPIKVLGPLPRLLNECCEDESHRIKIPPPFNQAPFCHIQAYYGALNHYMALHPKIDMYGSEFIPFQIIFRSDQGKPFLNNHLRDNVHLTDDGLKIFAEYVSGLTSKKPFKYKKMDIDSPSFRTWTAMTFKWNNKAQTPVTMTLKTAAGQGSQSGKRADPPKAPPLPAASQENMDAQSAPDNTQAKSVADFLSSTAGLLEGQNQQQGNST